MNEKFDELLNIVRFTKSKYKDKESFNVFHSIGFRSQEVMHSKFIATMLDPRGSHGMKSKNLKLFFDVVGLSELRADLAKVEVERPAGNRWIDIKISIGNDVIIIENKVWAKDQDRQLIDYYNSCKENHNRVEVVYLTLDGKRPSSISLGNNPMLTQKVICISYEKVIIPWIDECAKNAVGRVKVSLEMYSELVTDLINQNKYMNEIFEELKKDKENLKLAIDINSALQGRNYIKEFPETIEFLKSRIREIDGEADPHLDENDTILNISNEGHCLEKWRFYLEDGDVFYASNDQDGNIPLFQKSNINDIKLRGLIFNETGVVDEWLEELFAKMRDYK